MNLSERIESWRRVQMAFGSRMVRASMYGTAIGEAMKLLRESIVTVNQMAADLKRIREILEANSETLPYPIEQLFPVSGEGPRPPWGDGRGDGKEESPDS